jgi:glycosyltransferase involved in cell wall biosynthesis
MHIIALEHEPSSLRGGQELNLFEICRGLSHRGHKISLIYEKEGNLLEDYQNFCESMIKVNRYEFDRRKINHIFDFLFDFTVTYKISTSKNSVVFSNSYYSAFLGYVLSVFKRIPFVCYFQIPPLGGFTRQKRMGMNGVKQFIAVSNQTKSDWVKLGRIKEDKIEVVYNGTNIEKFYPSKDFSAIRKEWNILEDVKVVGYVGRLDRMKGLETLIKAFALLVKTGVSTRLLFAGKPIVHQNSETGEESLEEGENYLQFLKQLSIDLGIEKYVDFLGHVTNTTSVYQVSDVTVLPSEWPEPFPRSIIESMACGTPVVASRTGGIPENLTGEFQKGLFEPGNERDLSETLNRIMNWRDTDPQLGERCREHILAKFSLDKLVDGIEKVLLKVVKQ